MPFMGVVLKEHDRFVETFHTDRWYNIFEIYDRDGAGFKAWYCNIAYPAVFGAGTISFVDLPLDLWVAPHGPQTVLDEDEFAPLGLAERGREHALRAMGELRDWIKTQQPSG